MKLVVLVVFASVFGMTLPKRNFLKRSVVSTAGLGKSLQATIKVTLPAGQKLNLGANSQLTVYEKISGEWIRAQEIGLNDSSLIPGVLNDVTRTIRLSQESSDIAIDGTIYHCAAERGKGPCYIDNFQEKMKRIKGAPNTLIVELLPTKD